MNITYQINLGGYALTIDANAYQLLKDYLEAVSNQFNHNPGAEEIMYDIEYRMGEILSSNHTSKSIVTHSQVKDTIRIMGTPDEFGDIAEEPAVRTEPKRHQYAERKLYRDMEDKVLGGVASGISRYFSIDDSIWMRLLFIILAFTTGVGMIAYIILWIIVPKAKTRSDRMRMCGKPVDINSIAKQVEQDVREFSELISDSWKSGKEKHRQKWHSEI